MCGPVSHSPLYYLRCLYYHKLLNGELTDLLVEAIFQTFLLFQIEASLKDLSCLMEQYQVVSNRTKSLHQVSEQLLADQVLLFLKVWVFIVVFLGGSRLTVGLITLPRRCVFVCIWELPDSDVCQFTSYLDWSFESFSQFCNQIPL